MKATRTLISVASFALGTFTAAAQSTAFSSPQSSPPQLNESGQVVVDGRSTPYLIRHLPVSSFPDLPNAVQDALNQRGCLIPQTYEAHQPENVIRARFERPGSLDWAVLCSVQGTVSLLVFLTSNPDQPFVLASAPETKRLQAHGASGILGFNWGIDPATPNEVHQAQTGLAHRPPWVDHDAVADSVVDHRTIYHFYEKNAWTLLEMPQ
jgi:hypothetical protein